MIVLVEIPGQTGWERFDLRPGEVLNIEHTTGGRSTLTVDGWPAHGTSIQPPEVKS